MTKFIVIATTIAIVFSSVDLTHAESFSARQGDMWLGGSFSFLSTGVSYKEGDYNLDRQNTVLLSPIVRLFPTDYFTIGPKLSWAGLYRGKTKINLWCIGGEAGFVYGSKVTPYALVAPQASIQAFNSHKETLFYLPFTAGVLVPVINNLGMQFEIGYGIGFQEKYTSNTFCVGIGICGLGERTAVSLVNVFNGFGFGI